MNNVVLKGKLGAGFNDDRYTLPKDGNPGDILVKTETGSAWEKQEQGNGGRSIINGHLWNYDGVNYICIDETSEQLRMMYESGKDIFLEFNKMRFKYIGSLFYTIMPKRGDNTGIKEAAILVISNPVKPNINWNCPYKGICNVGSFAFNIQREG